jgi:hypothetical protein
MWVCGCNVRFPTCPTASIGTWCAQRQILYVLQTLLLLLYMAAAAGQAVAEAPQPAQLRL